MKPILRITMPDGSQWDIPTIVVARHRARTYAHEFGNNPDRSLKEDTTPLFNENPSAIADWASNQMNWKEVKDFAVCTKNAPSVDFQEGWVNGEKVLV